MDFLGGLARVVPIVQPACSKAACHVDIPQHNTTLRRGTHHRSWLTFKCDCEIAWNSTFVRCRPSRCPEVHPRPGESPIETFVQTPVPKPEWEKRPSRNRLFTYLACYYNRHVSTVRSHLHDVTHRSYSLRNVVRPTVEALLTLPCDAQHADLVTHNTDARYMPLPNCNRFYKGHAVEMVAVLVYSLLLG